MHLLHDPSAAASESIAFDEFLKVDIHVGTVLSAEPLQGARKPALALRIDFGDGVGEKKSSAQIANYDPEALIGRQVLAVVNFPPRQVGKFMSEVLVLGAASASGEIQLVAPDAIVPNGARMA